MIEIIKNNKISLSITIISIIIIGILYFFVGGLGAAKMGANENVSAYDEIKLKVVYTDEQNMKIFANAKNNALKEYSTIMGNSVPENNSVSIGYMEAKMMLDENLFSKPGDKLNNLFGIDVIIEGVLNEVKGPMDYFHFLNIENYNAITGDENHLFIKKIDDKTVKLYYTYKLNDKTKIDLEKIKFTDGNISNYKIHEIVGKLYYPLIIGSEEAKIMQEEKLFSNVGDLVNLFGENFIIVGILDKTNSAVDMMHFTTLNKNEFLLEG